MPCITFDLIMTVLKRFYFVNLVSCRVQVYLLGELGPGQFSRKSSLTDIIIIIITIAIILPRHLCVYREMERFHCSSVGHLTSAAGVMSLHYRVNDRTTQ